MSELFPVEFPVNSFDLIEVLDKATPHRCIAPGESLEQAHRYAGARELIDELVEWAREAREGEDDDSSSDSL